MYIHIYIYVCVYIYIYIYYIAKMLYKDAFQASLSSARLLDRLEQHPRVLDALENVIHFLRLSKTCSYFGGLQNYHYYCGGAPYYTYSIRYPKALVSSLSPFIMHHVSGGMYANADNLLQNFTKALIARLGVWKGS